MSVKTKTRAEKNNKISEIDEQILRTFDIKKRLGKGAYGIVWKATDRKTQQTVAVKKIFDAFRNETDAQRTFREIMFLRAFRNHPNIVQLYSIHRASNHMDIYLSFEFMESDLHNVIKRGSILKDIHKRFMMYQLLNATQFIHSGKVIHRDMKPSNVLVDSKCRCKIADFGLARSIAQPVGLQSSMLSTSDPQDEQCLTNYVATRWYRAPEILVASKKYTMGIDMWSLGCILGEMIRGKPLFPGSCTMNQIEHIVSALPNITDQDIQSVGGGFGSALLSSKSSKSPTPSLDELLAGSPDDARELVKSLLTLDPLKRLTARQALNHRYIEKFRNTSPECELNADVVPPFRDDVQLTVTEYRSKLYEIMSSNEKNGYVGKKLDKKDQHQLLQSAISVHPAPSSGSTTNLKASKAVHKLNVSTGTIKPGTVLSHHQHNIQCKASHKNGGTSYTNALARAAAPQNSNKITKNLSNPSSTHSFGAQTEDKPKRKSIDLQQRIRAQDSNSRLSAQRSSYAMINIEKSASLPRRRSLDIYHGQIKTSPPTRDSNNQPYNNGYIDHGRRQSCDNGITNGPPPVKLSRDAQENRLHSDTNNVRLVPSMSKHRLMSVLQSRSSAAKTTNTHDTNHKSASSNVLCFKTRSPPHSAMPTREESSYDIRLRLIEERVRNHNQNIRNTDSDSHKTGLNIMRQRRPTAPTQSYPIDGDHEQRSVPHRPVHQLYRSRPEYSSTSNITQNPVARTTFHLAPAGSQQSTIRNDIADIGAGGDNMLNRYNNRLAAANHSNYGVVRATDFYKLRSSEVTL